MLGVNLLTVTLQVLWQPHHQCHWRRSCEQVIFSGVRKVQCICSHFWGWEDSLLLVGLALLSAVLLGNKDAKEKHQHAFWPRAEVKVMACFPSALLSIFSMDYAYSRQQDRQRQVQTNIFQWLILGGGVFLLFGHMDLVLLKSRETWTFCTYSSRFLLWCSIVLIGNKTGGSLNWRIQAMSLSSSA